MSLNNIAPNHMDIYWHNFAVHGNRTVITDAGLTEKATLIGRVGLMLLSCGTGAWRVRSSMNTLAIQLGLTCTANIGLLSIDYTCFDGENCFTQSICLNNTGVNTYKLNYLERFIHDFPTIGIQLTGEQLHSRLDRIEKLGGLYKPAMLGLAAAFACGAFTFLLGGGLPEIICAFLGAGAGNYVRSKLLGKKFTLFLCIVTSVALGCITYTVALRTAELLLSISPQHQAGYICAMLFIIPGFPFITSGIDFAKLDFRSGLERLAYAIIITVVATITAWATALALNLQPVEFPDLTLSVSIHLVLRLIASFCGVFGFSIMFNSPVSMAASSAVVGAIANTFRLELVDMVNCPPSIAAFIGALMAGLLASLINRKLGYPRISLTVPSIVIMVPGLFLYRAVYNLGAMSLSTSTSYFASAMLIILALPLGLIFARIITDKSFRYCN